MNKSFLILFFIFCIDITGFSQQNETISIGFAGKEASMKPGSIQTIIYKIKNNTDSILQLQPKVDLPERWKLISQLIYLTIPGDGQQILIVSFNIPSQYPAGKHKILLKLTDIQGKKIVFGSTEREVEVREEVDFHFEHIKSPPTVRAGEVIKASFIVRNTGNVEQTFTAIPSNCQVQGNQRIKLKPGEASVINVEASTNKELEMPNKQSFYLMVKASGGPEQQLYEHVNVIPVTQTTNDLYHRFPVTATSRYLSKGRGGEYVSGYQFALSGAGTLDPEEKHKLDFILRGPNQFDLSLLGLYDQYYMHYNYEFLDISIGDKSYGLTPLTEFGRYGRGVETRFQIKNNIHAGAFYVNPRFYDKAKGEFGAVFRYTIP